MRLFVLNRTAFVNRIALAVLCAVTVWLAGCASSKPAVEPTAAKCAAGATDADAANAGAASAACAPEAPKLDSLRAKMAITLVDENGKEQSLDAVLFSVPRLRYRMEFTGPMGIGVASMLWTEEGWTMTFPTEKLYMKGRGYMVGLFNAANIPMVNIHQIAGFFDGEYMPEGTKPVSERDSAGLKLVEADDAMGIRLTYAVRDGQVEWISKKGRDGKPEVLKFMDYRQFEGRTLAGKIVFERDGKMFLTMRLKKVTHGKPFSLGTWRLKVPASYKPVM